MPYDPRIHHRRSTRLQAWDYSWPWWYYVTICTHERRCIFGNVVNDEMQLNDLGKVVHEEWTKTPSVRTEVELDDFVVMPNHFHGIIIMNDSVIQSPSVGTHGRASHNNTTTRADIRPPLRREPRSLGSLIAGYKSVVTKRINILRGTPGKPVWQGRFHDHIIRNEADLNRIRTYIANNPLQWGLDEENPDNLK